MRLLTWNVNGLRPALRRGDMSLAAFLASLNADICCFQETKLTRNELLMDSDLSAADGWESFFSCTRGKTGYSGVATFCKASVTMPVSAEEGFTGLLQLPGCKASSSCTLAEQTSERYSRDELLELDAEGRCVITDHGHFVLFNLYAPALSSADRMEERFAFKLKLFEVLFGRMEAYRSQGRRVVLVGDLNIAPAAIDSCDPGTGAEFTAWLNRSDRAFLRGNLQQHGGAYVDIFRTFNPDRKQAYTCWNQASSARVNNWGTRIDLILLADALSPEDGQQGFAEQWVAADIEPERQGSDHAPAWADLTPLQPLSLAATPPALASRFLFTGKQQTLASWLCTRPGPAPSASQPASVLPEQNTAAAHPVPSLASSHTHSQDAAQPAASHSSHHAADVFRELPAQPQAHASRGLAGKRAGSGASRGGSSKRSKPAQSSMRAFFAASAPAAQMGLPSGSTAASAAATASRMRSRLSSPAVQGAPVPGSAKPAHQEPTAAEVELHAEDETGTCQQGNAASAPASGSEGAADGAVSREGSGLLAEATSNTQMDRVAAAAAWRQIQHKMKPPKCPGHNEDCIIREVKKAGPNKGRLFYVCARPDGPKPKGRCDHFQWIGDRKVRSSASS